ncbi:MAG TPA: PKD domain-containing protein [Mucilaginibacter sp.]|nr:PKD domain-containing protein [Mucilaginibacter sp.]
MKIFVRSVTVIAILICCTLTARPQNTTNSGTEFWTAYMLHNSGASTDGNGTDNKSLMSLYITSAVNTSGTVAIADGSFLPIPFTVTANQVTIITIPPPAYLSSAGVANKGIHITSLKPVAIYAHIYARSVSGATLLLPVSTLGKDYFSINYTQQSNAGKNNPAYSAFIVIATEDNTSVQIKPKATLLDGNAAGVTFTVNLKKGEIYQGLSSDDLTGTTITSVNSATGSCTRVAVFSGSSKIEVGCNPKYTTSDNLFQQVYPTASWGKSYITVPLASRNYDVFRIILSNPAATSNPNVKVNATVIPLTSFSNGYYEFSSQQPNVITADQPIQVVQYSVTQDNTIDCGVFSSDTGDPEMIYLNPLEQTLDHVTLYSTGNYQILNSFINVVIKTSAVPTFMLDGVSYTSFTPVPGNPLYSYAAIAVQHGPQDVQVSSGSQGTHTLSAGDGFNAIAYGFGQVESYGYAAGTNLQDLNKNITLANPVNDTVTQANGCIGVSYKLQLTLPYQTTKIVWDIKNGTTYTDSNPQVISTVTKGTQTLYKYEYYKIVNYTQSGDTSVVATVFDPFASTCGSAETIEFDFNISAPPVASSFGVSTVCLTDSTQFTDKTNVNGSLIKTWLWDFGDNTTSAQQNPKHIYANPGNYKVTLSVTNVNGCGTDTSQVIYVNHKPVANFTMSAPACAGKAVTFTDQSTSVDGKITQWIWNYGDGKSDTLANNKPVNHIYTAAGTDSIKLTVFTDRGCSNVTPVQVITISPAPAVDFSLPDVCLNDAFAQFTDKSTIADGSESGFTYLWDFGDPNAKAVNPNTSALKNPSHKYTQVGNYNVTLTVQSASGCIFSKTQPFTVNGDIPVAAFSVVNSNNLCSIDDVVFQDQSTVNFGNITKVIWYFDYNNNPENAVVFNKDSLPANRLYRHNYGLFNTPASKSYLVKMDVYSGISCVSSTQQTITVKANPFVTLSALGSLCQGDQPVQVIENTNGFTGSGVFTGRGISSTGLFNPATAGVGKFTINYTFTAQNGCDYSTSQQVTVRPAPTVSAGSDFFMLEGGSEKIKATAGGDNLTYKWFPSTGLDHDDILNPTVTPTINTTYKLVVTNSEGCSAASEVNVSVLKYPVIPNTFTPNGDGINDTWNILYLNTYPGNTVEIFDRYGKKVFSSIGYTTPWDGTYNGAVLPSGTFYYVIDPKNGRKVIAGSVTIVR